MKTIPSPIMSLLGPSSSPGFGSTKGFSWRCFEDLQLFKKIFPLYLCMHIMLVPSSILVIKKIPVVDPAFGKWFLKLPLTAAPTVIVKDLPIPEIDRYPGEWGEHGGEYVIYKRGDQLWERWIENGKVDSTRLLYQVKSEFIPDKYKPFKSLYFYVKDGKADAFSIYYGAIGNSGQTKRKK